LLPKKNVIFDFPCYKPFSLRSSLYCNFLFYFPLRELKMDHNQAPSLSPGERLNRYGQVYNFEKWKQSKILDGTWLENVDEWKKKKQTDSPSVDTPIQVQQFPSRVLPPSNTMGEYFQSGRTSAFDLVPPVLEDFYVPSIPVYIPPFPEPVSTPPVYKQPQPKKKDAWIPLQEFIENRKRKNEEYVEKEEKVLRMSNDYQTSDDMSRRVVIFDTETTGLSDNHEIVEIAMIETIEGIKTGRHLHFFINPDGENTQKAYEIHRLTKESLGSHPKFEQVAHKIASFIGTSTLMAHNAKFDMGMLNRGMVKAGLKPYPPERFICTVKMARQLFPGENNRQDDLCRRFGVDNFNRETTGIHSAIEDTTQLYHCFRAMIPILEKKNLCWSQFRL